MDRVQVKHIQEEYQKYMERVRGKAQGSIDQANLTFQARRHDLTGHVDNIVAFMQQRFLSVQVLQTPPTPWSHSKAVCVARLALSWCWHISWSEVLVSGRLQERRSDSRISRAKACILGLVVLTLVESPSTWPWSAS